MSYSLDLRERIVEAVAEGQKHAELAARFKVGVAAVRCYLSSSRAEIEGLVEHHRKLQERIEYLEADAAQFDTAAQGVLGLSRKADDLRRALVVLLEGIAARIKR